MTITKNCSKCMISTITFAMCIFNFETQNFIHKHTCKDCTISCFCFRKFSVISLKKLNDVPFYDCSIFTCDSRMFKTIKLTRLTILRYTEYNFQLHVQINEVIQTYPHKVSGRSVCSRYRIRDMDIETL